MSLNLNEIGAVVLGAGKGTRLNCVDRPKVMLEIGGRPIVSHIVATLQSLGLGQKQICLVVGFQKEQVQKYFGDRVSYAVQEIQAGTAHAAYMGIKSLLPEIKTVLVLGGDDSAFYRPETIRDFIEAHQKSSAALSLLSTQCEDPGAMGRIVRTDKGVEIIEKEYLTEEQRRIREMSTGTFCFDRQWFESMFPSMPQLRKLGEWGLPTALAMAREQGVEYQVIKLSDPDEWFGINTVEELKEADIRITRQSESTNNANQQVS